MFCRKLAGLVLEAVNQGGQEATPANHHDSTQATDVSCLMTYICNIRVTASHVHLLVLLQRIDLTGERDFLTGETTEDALAAMLKPGSKIAQVGVNMMPLQC